MKPPQGHEIRIEDQPTQISDPTNPVPVAGKPALPSFVGYEVMGEVARGGMGVVYRARQLNPSRVVALKMLLPGVQSSEVEVQRFLLEAENAARLDHPNIVPIYEVGYHLGCPFFSMRLIEGGSLKDRIPQLQKQLPTAIALFIKVARAVHFAHQRGLLHRDLKPANILVDREGQPYVTDFGLAKQVEGDSGLTRTGAVMGTPSYMPPEQANGEKRLTTAADVYSLGAILYELLTGKPPFRGGSVMETLLHVLEREPVAPSQVKRGIDRDLETICLKCLQKDPSHRYGSADALADDLERWLCNEPILARRSTLLERCTKWARRRPAIASLTLLLILVAVAGFGATAWQLQETESERTKVAQLALTEAEARERAEKDRLDAILAKDNAIRAGQEAHLAREEADRARDQAERNLSYTRIVMAHNEWLDNQVRQAQHLLDRCRQADRHWEWNFVRRLCSREQTSIRLGPNPVLGLTLTPDGKYLACGYAQSITDSTIHLLDTSTWKRVRSFAGLPDQRLLSLAISPDGKWLAAGHEGFNIDRQKNDILLLDLASGQPKHILRGHESSVWDVAFSPDSKVLVSVGGVASRADLTGEIKIWNVPGGTLEADLTRKPTRSNGSLRSVAFDPQGRFLAVGSADGTTRLLKPGTWTPLRTMTTLGRAPHTLAFSPDGSFLASHAELHAVKLRNPVDGSEKLTIPFPNTTLHALAISPDGKQIALAFSDLSVRVYNAQTGVQTNLLRGHTFNPQRLVFLPGGKRLVSSSWDGFIKVWDLQRPDEAHAELRVKTLRSDVTTGLHFSQDGQHLALARGRIVQLWPTRNERSEHEHTFAGMVEGIAFLPGGKELAVGLQSGFVVRWDWQADRATLWFQHGALCTVLGGSRDGRWLVTAGKDVKVWTSEGKLVKTLTGLSKNALGVAITDDGQRVAACSGKQGELVMWDLATGQQLFRRRTSSWALAFNPQGTRLAEQAEAVVQVWDLRAGTPLDRSTTPRWTVPNTMHRRSSLSFSPDGKRLAVPALEELIRLVDVDNGEVVLPLRAQAGARMAAAFSPVGELLATASAERVARLWDGRPWSVTQNTRGTLFAQQRGLLRAVAVSPDGKLIAAAGPARGGILLRNVATRQTVHTLTGYNGFINALQFRGDGKQLVSASADGILRIWDVATGKEFVRCQETRDAVNVAWSADGKVLISIHGDGSITQWDPKRGVSLHRWRMGEGPLQGLALSPSGQLVAVGDAQSKRVKVWDTTTHREVALLPTSAPIQALAFSANGTRLVIGTTQRAIHLYETTTWEETAAVEAIGNVRSLACSPRGEAFVVGTENGEIQFWDTSSEDEGELVAPLELLGTHPTTVNGLAFAPRGLTLFSCGLDGQLIAWKLDGLLAD